MTADPAKWRLPIFAAVGIVYLAARVWGLTASCLWFDEIFSVHAAEHTFSEIYRFIAADLIHPPLFYLLLKGWIAVGGESLLWLRMLPVVLSALALVPFYFLCVELRLGTRATAIAASFLAVNGSLIKYSQEVRMYSLLFLLAVCSIWLFARFFYRGKSFWLLILVNVLAVYTHYFGWLLIVGEVAAILIFQRLKIRRMLLMAGIAALAFVPWIWALLKAEAGAGIAQNIGWIGVPGFRSIFELLFDLVEPFYYQRTSADPISLLYISIPLLLILGAAKVHFLLSNPGHDNSQRFLLLVSLAAVPVLAAFLVSWILPVSVWGTRHLIVVFPVVAVLVGMILGEDRRRRLTDVLLGAAVVLIAGAFIVELLQRRETPIWCYWSGLSVSAEDGPPTLYVFEDAAAYHLWFEHRNDNALKVVKVDGVQAEDKAYFLPRGFSDVERTTADKLPRDRLWFAFRSRSWDEGEPPLALFQKAGYEMHIRQAFEAGRERLYLVEASK
jgi:uncharacterized membrane protein